MRLRLFLLTFCLLTLSATVFAAAKPDSVGVENHKGKRVVIYKIKPKDTYYAIARRYHIDPKELQSYNDNAKMTIGHTIKVPTGKPFVEPKHEKAIAKNDKKKKKHDKPEEEQPEEQPAEKPQAVVVQPPPVQQPQQQAPPPDNTPPTQYKVSAGETLYSIAKRFNTTVDNIMALNGLKSNTISPGQLLNIKANAAAPAPVTAPAVMNTSSDSIVAKRDSTIVATPQDSANIANYHANANKFGLYEKDEKGVATWMDDEGLDANKKLVLHRTAPIGTVIKITNIMTNRTTFAKVVGRFTDNEQTKDVIIVMTKNVAEALGALDKRFQVSLSYGVPNQQ
ncbi:MAG TPA: LysM peptidoglycan-binding domain-containing protein [Mucilaginibacter sp.]|jgi:LysM repeat protein|nr:LysM peptidoglycan-binding domain-containing protein [Mucilaginibacter sp.]